LSTWKKNVEFDFGEQKFAVARVKNSSEGIPESLKELFETNSGNLNKTQKNIFANFLREFSDSFSKEIIAGTCDILEHVINIKDVELY